MTMKLRIVERSGRNHSIYYIVQKKTWFGWYNLWPDCCVSTDGWTTWDRTFSTTDDAEDAIKEYVHNHQPDKVIKVLEVK